MNIIWQTVFGFNFVLPKVSLSFCSLSPCSEFTYILFTVEIQKNTFDLGGNLTAKSHFFLRLLYDGEGD